MKKPQVLIIPDIHGRKFWKEAIDKFPKKDYPDLQIIFLGDYLDPYSSIEDIDAKAAYDNFLDILDYIKNDDRIIPLIGNHDWHYFVSLDICRIDSVRQKNIEHLFIDNMAHFRLTYTVELNGHKYLFSHAGVTQGWLDDISMIAKYEIGQWNPGEGDAYVDLVNDDRYIWINKLSNINKTYDFELLEECLIHYDDRFYSSPISMISRDRGGWDTCGSCIWADIREHLYNGNIPEYYQIFAHTNTYPKYQPYIIKDMPWAMLDCRQAFIIDIERNIEKI